MNEKTSRIAYLSVVHFLHDHRFLYKQCKGLADNGFEVDYYVQAPKESVINNVHIKPLKAYDNRVKRFLSTFVLLPRLLKCKYDAIHLVDPELLPLGMLSKLFTKSVVIFDAHEDYVDFMKHKHYLKGPTGRFFSWAIKFVLNLSSRLLDGFVFADERTADEFEKLPLERRNIFHNFPVRSMFPEKQQKWQNRKYNIVFLGTMSQTSGTFIILEAINRLKSEFASLKCLFIGRLGDEIKQQVDEYIRQNDLGKHIEITGRLPHNQIPQLLQECKIGLFGLVDIPKFHKNIATKIFEYMASSIPVVSSDLPPERKYIVSGERGYLVPPGDSAAMAEAIFKIISDVEIGQRMSDACRKYMLERKYFAAFVKG